MEAGGGQRLFQSYGLLGPWPAPHLPICGHSLLVVPPDTAKAGICSETISGAGCSRWQGRRRHSGLLLLHAGTGDVARVADAPDARRHGHKGAARSSLCETVVERAVGHLHLLGSAGGMGGMPFQVRVGGEGRRCKQAESQEDDR